MDTDRVRTLIVTAIILLIILGLIIGAIYLIGRIIQNRKGQTFPSPTPITTTTNSPLPTILPTVYPSVSSSPHATNTPVPNNTKVYQGAGFSIYYPANWGLLTCNNSQNFELDPINSADQLNISCDYARKPISVIVNSNNCQGSNVTLGNITVNKQVDSAGTYKRYKWCAQTTPKLEFSERVSPNGERATSKNDFSTQVETLIKSLRFSGAS